MIFLKAYIIGFLFTLLIELLIEHFYYGNGRGETVTVKDVLEDIVVALFSWLGLVGVIIWFWGEWYTDFPMKGYGEFLHDYEDSLSQESEDAEEKE
jgi:hypothetical protein